MQAFKKCVAVACLSVALVGAAVSGQPAYHPTHPAGAVDVDAITIVLNLVQLASRISLPPG